MRIGFTFTILDTVEMALEDFENREKLNEKIQESLDSLDINRSYVNDIEVEVLD